MGRRRRGDGKDYLKGFGHAEVGDLEGMRLFK